MRRLVLIAIAIAVPLLWAFVPYGRMPPGFGTDEPGRAKTFGGMLVPHPGRSEEGPHLRLDLETAALLTAFPALAAPLYPAVFAIRLLAMPRRMAARRRWIWLLESSLVLLLSWEGIFWASFSLEIFIPGAGSSTLYPTLWLLPGFAALAALTVIAIGIMPRSRFAGFVLGAAAKPAILGPVGTNSTIGSSTPSPKHVLRWLRTRLAAFALCGVGTGAVTAAVCTVAKVGEVEPFAISGYCLGVQVSGAGVMQGGACTGIDGAFYLFPGLVFGIAFGPLLRRRSHLSGSGAIGYALAAVVANAVAVTVCVSAVHPLNDLLPFDNPVLDLAVAGIIAGAVGGGLLGMILRALNRGGSLRPGIMLGGALGMLAPLIIMFDATGGFAFYMIWQGGYAAAVAAGLQSVE
jgi:hypothetical protein